MISQAKQRQLIIQSTYALLRQPNLDYSLQILYDSLNSVVVNKQPIVEKKYIPIKAVYGILNLSINKYLIVVTKADIVAQVFKYRVYRVKKVEMIVLSSYENSIDTPLKNEIVNQLQNGSYYYSDEYDLTRPISFFVDNYQTVKQENRNNRYFYNYFLADEFIKLNKKEWITAFIHGSIVFNYFTISSTEFNCSLMLVSRMDRQRQGARWFSRGCDANGHTAFKVETEIIFIAVNNKKGTSSLFSFFQVRGQIPLVWSQMPDILWEPEIYLLKNQKVHIQIIKKYLLGLKQKHELVCLVNLLDRTNENEKRLGQYYENLLKMFPLQNIRHSWFELKASDIQNNLEKSESMIIQKLGQFIKAFGYYHLEYRTGADKQDRVERNHQAGIFRMTSIECLIRVDIVQRVISKQLLQQWIYKIGLVTDRSHNHSQKLPESLDEIFNASWAINSHRLSKIYTGTTNIRQDIIARKDRRRVGILIDYYSLLKRYILGTFYDWNKQNINDILTGRLECKGKGIRTTSHRYFLGVSGMVIIVVWVVFQLIEEALEESKINNLLPIQIFWSLLAVSSIFLVVKNNKFLPKPQIHY